MSGSNTALDVVLKEIKKIDTSTYNRILTYRKDIETAECWQIVQTMQKKKKDKLRKLRSLESVSHNYDLSNLIQVVYNTMDIVEDGNPTGILFGDNLEKGTFIPADLSVVKLARTVIQLSISKNEDVFKAFSDAFQTIVRLGIVSNEVQKITVQRVIDAFDFEIKGESLNKDIYTSIVKIMKGELSE